MTEGYIRYFEPDAYVEAEPGLLEAAGLGAFQSRHLMNKRALPLSGLFAKKHGRDFAEPGMGLSILDAMADIYRSERRFELKQTSDAVLVKPVSRSLVAELLFGCYPIGAPVSYFKSNYLQVFEAKEIAAGPEAWKQVFKQGALTPMRFTRYKTEIESGWWDSFTVYVFDPTNPLDCIDLWNMRSERPNTLPVPVEWWDDLLPEILSALRAQKPSIGQARREAMHQGTLEFARSIAPDRAEIMLAQAAANFPDGGLSYKTWRNPIWQYHQVDDVMGRNGPIRLKVAQKHVSLSLSEDRLSSEIEFLSPDFAGEHASSSIRWVNTVLPSQFHEDRLGITLPFNAFDPFSTSLSRYGEPVFIGREGWSFGLKFKDISGRITIPEAQDAVIKALKGRGIKARLSEPGHIAKQILEHLGELWGVRILKDVPTLELLNTMAGGIRIKGKAGDQAEELFDRRSKPIRDWHALVERRKSKGRGISSLEDFTGKNIIRLGLQSKCPTCALTNWHSLSVLNYDVVCERCQKTYPFPQASLERDNRNWAFRVLGPFAVPDYARGSYGALLALHTLRNLSGSQDRLTFTTALSLQFDDMEAEADFVALHAPERHTAEADPRLIFCEAKSFGNGPLITAKDIAKLRLIARKIEGAVIVISVLRNHFVPEELKVIEPFVRWCRRPDERGQMRNPVILLTGIENFSSHDVGLAWKQQGGIHKQFEDFRFQEDLLAFAAATQSIYLKMPDPYAEQAKKASAGKAR